MGNEWIDVSRHAETSMREPGGPTRARWEFFILRYWSLGSWKSNSFSITEMVCLIGWKYGPRIMTTIYTLNNKIVWPTYSRRVYIFISVCSSSGIILSKLVQVSLCFLFVDICIKHKNLSNSKRHASDFIIKSYFPGEV